MAESERLAQLRRRVQSDPASIAFAALAEEYRRLGLVDEAIETARAGLRHHPAYVSARVTLGRALLEAGRDDEARRELEAALAAAPENLAALRALIEVYRHAGEVARARDLARRGVALAPQDREWRALLHALADEAGPTASPARFGASSETRGTAPVSMAPTVDRGSDGSAWPPAGPDLVPAPGGGPEADGRSTSPPAALSALEDWLDAIVRERERRHASGTTATADPAG